MIPFIKTFNSIIKARLWGFMLTCAVLGIAVVICMVGLVTWLSAVFVHIQIGWLDTSVNWMVGLLAGIGGWFMLPALIVLIGGVFQEKTIDRVERAYYPDRLRQKPPGFWPDIFHDVQFTMWALFLNILVLPLYLLGIGFMVAIVLNSYLMGREFFESAAGYHIGKPKARELGQKHKIAMYSGGLVITLMTLVPVLNLFVPILATVWMVHIYHYLNPARQNNRIS
jgi:CysZ protein